MKHTFYIFPQDYLESFFTRSSNVLQTYFICSNLVSWYYQANTNMMLCEQAPHIHVSMLNIDIRFQKARNRINIWINV